MISYHTGPATCKADLEYVQKVEFGRIVQSVKVILLNQIKIIAHSLGSNTVLLLKVSVQERFKFISSVASI